MKPRHDSLLLTMLCAFPTNAADPNSTLTEKINQPAATLAESPHRMKWFSDAEFKGDTCFPVLGGGFGWQSGTDWPVSPR